MKLVHCSIPLLVFSCFAVALESDQEQPIQIEADAAMIDEANGNSIHKGNVVIEQGTLQLRANEVEIISSNNELIQIIASADGSGNKLAHYEQQTNDAGDRVLANAEKITYLIQEKRLHLSGNARLQQVDDVFTGELLYYDLEKGVVNLDSGDSGERVKMQIKPRSSSE